MIIEKQICECLLDLMEEKPYHKIKVSELVKNAGISRSSFYFYYESIPDVVEQIENNFIKGISDESTAAMRIVSGQANNVSFSDLIRPTIQYVYSHLRVFRILTGPNGNSAFQTRLTERIYNIYNILHSASQANSRIDKTLICELMSGAQWSLYKWWANHEKDASVDDMVEFVTRLLNCTKSFF